jgi:hypothetical protein
VCPFLALPAKAAVRFPAFDPTLSVPAGASFLIAASHEDPAFFSFPLPAVL